MKFPLLVAATLLFSLACKPSQMGTKVDWETVTQFKSGVTTAQDVVSKLGPATLISKISDNEHKFRWTHLNFKNRHEAEIQTVELIFDSKLILQETPNNKPIIQHINNVAIKK